MNRFFEFGAPVKARNTESTHLERWVERWDNVGCGILRVQISSRGACFQLHPVIQISGAALQQADTARRVVGCGECFLVSVWSGDVLGWGDG